MNNPIKKTEDLGQPELDRLEELLSYHFDDNLSDEDSAELNGLLASNPSAIQRTVEMSRLHADLHELFSGEAPRVAPPLPIAPGVVPVDQPAG